MEITNEVASIIVIALIVAIIVEGVKHTPLNAKLSVNLIQLLTLLLGLIGGLIAMNLIGGSFAQFVMIGLTGAVASNGVYDLVKNLTNGKITKKVGE